MKNILIIAKKEFNSLITSQISIFLVTLVILLSIGYFINYMANVNSSGMNFNAASMVLCIIANIFTTYMSLIAIVIGFSSMTSEFNNGALNTMIGKPLYRDTIINGKLIGITGFMVCTCGVILGLIILLSFLFVSNFSDELYSFIQGLPAVFTISILCIIFYLSISMFISIVIKNQTLALSTSLFVWVFIEYILTNLFFTYSIANVMGLFGYNVWNLNAFIVDFAPTMIEYEMFKPIDSITTLFNNNIFDVVKLLVYSVATISLCYSAFLRRDIS